MLNLNKEGQKIIELYHKDKFDDYRFKDFEVKPNYTIYYDKTKSSNNEVSIVNELQDNIPFPYLDNKYRQSIYVSGNSGSGKTTLICNLIQLFLKRNNNLMILYFTGICGHDKHLEDFLKKICNKQCILINPKSFYELRNKKLRVPLSVSEITKYQLTINNRPFLCVFDDTELIQDRMIRNALSQFRDDILLTGRAHGKEKHINIIVVNHQTNDWNKTRLIQLESKWSAMNLRSVNNNTIKNICEKFGYSQEVIDTILKLKRENGGMSFFSSDFPYVIMNNKAIILQN